MKAIKLPQSVFAHPRGYAFSLAMEAATTPMEQLAVVSEYKRDVVDPSMLVGTDTHDVYKAFLDERDVDNAAPNYNGILPVEYHVHLLEDADGNYVVWLLDEDSLYVGVRYGVPAAEVFDKAREAFFLFRVTGSTVEDYEAWKSAGANEVDFLVAASKAKSID